MTTISPTITEVTVTPVLISDPPLLNVAGVHQPYTPRCIIEVHTDTGITGIGETYGDGAYLDIAHKLAKAIVGRPVAAITGLPQAALESNDDLPTEYSADPDASGFRGRLSADKLRLSVVSGFEVACFDALGKQLGVPVHSLLGGKIHNRVEYSGYLFYKWGEHPGEHNPADPWDEAIDPAGVVAQARRFQNLYGFSSFKLKGGAFAPDEEVSAILALRSAFPGARLRLDPNGCWSVETAVRVAHELTGVLEYLEDPVFGTPNMAEVRRRTGMTLATNMCVTALSEIPEAFASDAVQVVLCDHHYWGGLLATRDLEAICCTWGRTLSMHSNTHLGVSLAAMTHVASTLPGARHAYDTHRPWQTEDVITAPHEFVDGCVEVSDEPGLGIELDHDALARLHARWNDLPQFRERDDIGAYRVKDPSYERPTFPKF